jgi:ornithine carbamoyltransferase
MTDEAHPCQTLADLLTMREHLGELAGLKVVYLGAGLNVGRSLMLGCTKMEVDFWMCCPPGHEPPVGSLQRAAESCESSGGSLYTSDDPRKAVAEADVVYTDGWTPPELQAQHETRRRALQSYRVDTRLLSSAGGRVKVMHCLSAHYGEEVTEEVIHGPQSLVFDQAENRLHTQKAIMAALTR